MAHQASLTWIRNGRILAPDGASLVEADILCEHGRIQQWGPPGSFSSTADRVIDARRQLILPGLVNGHTHAHGALGKGMVPDRISLEGFLGAAPALLRGRTTEDLHTSALLSAAEAIRKGTTACLDMSVEMPAPSVEGLIAVGQAYEEAGIRAVVAPMIADRTLYQAYPELLQSLPAAEREKAAALVAPSASQLMATLAQAQREWPFDRSRVQLGVAPTIPLHCSDELLRACGRFSREHGLPLQTHLAESKLQALFGRADRGGLVQRLAALDCLSPLTSVAHAIWLNEADMALLARHGATAIHNPASNLRLGSGLAAVRQLLDAGVALGIGTDASNTSDGQSMFEATRLACTLSRLTSADWSRWISVTEAWSAATEGSARALGLGPMGRIEPGHAADLLLIDLDHLHYVPLRHPLRQLVLAESGAALRSVLVAGEPVMLDGHLTRIDEAQLRDAVRAACERLDGPANAAMSDFEATLMPAWASFCCRLGQAPFDIARRIADA